MPCAGAGRSRTKNVPGRYGELFHGHRNVLGAPWRCSALMSADTNWRKHTLLQFSFGKHLSRISAFLFVGPQIIRQPQPSRFCLQDRKRFVAPLEPQKKGSTVRAAIPGTAWYPHQQKYGTRPTYHILPSPENPLLERAPLTTTAHQQHGHARVPSSGPIRELHPSLVRFGSDIHLVGWALQIEHKHWE